MKFNYKGVIIIGYFNRTTFSKNNFAKNNLKDLFEKHGYKVLYLTDDLLNNNHTIPLKNKQRKSKVSVLSKEEKSKWISIAYSSWRNFSKEETVNKVSEIENYATLIYKTFKPTLFIGWNNLEFIFALYSIVFSKYNVPVLSFESGVILDTFRIDFKNQLEKKYIDKYHKNHYELGNKLLSNIKPSDQLFYGYNSDKFQNDKIILDKTVVVFGMLDADAGLDFKNDLQNDFLPGFKSSFDLALYISENTNYQVIFKPHPLSQKCKNIKYSSKNIIISNDNSIFLSKKDFICVVMSSKVIFPLILNNNKVITYGFGFFNGIKVGVNALNKMELIEKITNFPYYNYDLQKIKLKYIIGYFYNNEWLNYNNELKSFFKNEDIINKVLEKYISKSYKINFLLLYLKILIFNKQKMTYCKHKFNSLCKLKLNP